MKSNSQEKMVALLKVLLYLDFVQDAKHQSGRKWGELYNPYLDQYNYPKAGDSLILKVFKGSRRTYGLKRPPLKLNLSLRFFRE